MKKKVLYGVTFALLGCASMVSLQSCKDDLSDLEHRVNSQRDINAMSLQELWEYCRDNGDTSLDGRIKALENFLEAIRQKYPNGSDFANAFQKINDDLYGDGTNEGLIKKFNDLKDEIDKEGGIKDDVADLEERVAVLEKQVEAIIDRLDNLITGIIIQRAFGDVFGDFSLPIGIQSNMLFNWYGKNVTGIENFPSKEFDDVAATVDFSKFTPESTADYYKDINLGTLYLTVNPAGHNFDGTKVSLETSDGETLDATAFPLSLEESNDKLMFGATRSTTGFYKTALEVKNNPDVLNKIEVSLDNEKLKSAVKAVAKDPSAGSAAQLVKAVYDQLKTQVPAYAVRYDWEAPAANFTATTGADGSVTVAPTDAANATNKYSVRSKYELAVATARPLSFSSFDGISSNKKLPTFGHLDNLIEKLKDNKYLKFNFNSTINFDNVKIVLGDVKVSAPAGKLNIKIPQVDVYDTDGNLIGHSEPTPIPSDNIQGMSDITDEIASNIESSLKDVMDNLNKQLNDDVLGEIKKQVDNMIAEMNKQINDQIQGFIGDLSDQAASYFDRVNKVFDLYNKVANKLNDLLANPSAALQVNAFYDTKDDLGRLSQKASDPTQFAGNGNVIKIYLTSNTGEFIAPAYKKFFACTDTSVNSGDLGKVLPGTTSYVEIDATKLTKDQTYEFVYQALDYSGHTSTKKFYIVVK